MGHLADNTWSLESRFLETSSFELLESSGKTQKTKVHSDPQRANFGTNYTIAEKSNLIKTSMEIYGFKEDTLGIKIKQKVDFLTFESGEICLQSWMKLTLFTFHVIFGRFLQNAHYNNKFIC